MHYSVDLTIPAGTADSSPATQDIELPAGVLQHCTVIFPPGCSRMVKVSIWNATSQIFPRNAAEKYAEDNYHFEIGETYMMDSVTTLTVKGSAPDTSYQHKVTCHFEVRTAEEIGLNRVGYY